MIDNGIKIPKIQSRIRIEYFSSEQWAMNVESNKKIERNKGKQKMNKRQIIVKQQQ
jgi:hypothetical protein